MRDLPRPVSDWGRGRRFGTFEFVRPKLIERGRTGFSEQIVLEFIVQAVRKTPFDNRFIGGCQVRNDNGTREYPGAADLISCLVRPDEMKIVSAVGNGESLKLTTAVV